MVSLHEVLNYLWRVMVGAAKWDPEPVGNAEQCGSGMPTHTAMWAQSVPEWRPLYRPVANFQLCLHAALLRRQVRVQ